MSSTATVALFLGSLLTAVSATALIGMSPTGVMAESTQQLPAAVQTVPAAERQRGSSQIAGAATILKVPPTAAPQLPAAVVQPLTPSTEPFSASVSSASPGAVSHAAVSGAVGNQMGTVASASTANAGASTEAAVRMQVHGLNQLFPADPIHRRIYERAASLFPTFCRDWELMLHEREINNLEHLIWSEQRGLETAVYTGYGKVESCECKASKEGLPIGKIRYEEINYSLAGKTIDQAKHTAPKLTGHVDTLEIFSWEENKWFY